jgi:hypothetical protein
MEPYGLITYKRLDLSLPDMTSRNYMQAIEDCISSTLAPHRWIVESSLTLGSVASNNLLLKRLKANSWTASLPEPQYPQILLTYKEVLGNRGTISVRYAPNGGFTIDPLTGDVISTPVTASPERRLTRRSDNLNFSRLCGGIYVIEYDDAAAFVFESLVPFDFWSWGIMAGSLYYPFNNSDDEYIADATSDYPGIFPFTQPRTTEFRLGDAVLVGPTRWRSVPTLALGGLSTAPESWLNCMPSNFGPLSITAGSVARISDTVWDGLITEFTPATTLSNTIQGRNSTDGLLREVERFSPYFVRTENSGLLGMSKYVRTSRLIQTHRTKYVSTTLEPGYVLSDGTNSTTPQMITVPPSPPTLVRSQQAWMGYSGFGNTSELLAESNTNNVILWRRDIGANRVPVIVL